MRVKILKKRNKFDIDNILEEFARKHGSLGSLHQRVLISKCSTPKQMSDYVLWKHLSSGADLKDTIVVENSDIFNVLSPKRVELLEFLTNNEVKSIKSLAHRLHRNYKNVYDDLRALSKYDLIELRAVGRSVVPCSIVSEIDLRFDD